MEKAALSNAGSAPVAGFARVMRGHRGSRMGTKFIRIAHEAKATCPYNLGGAAANILNNSEFTSE